MSIETNAKKFGTGEIKNDKPVLVRELTNRELEHWLGQEWLEVRESETHIEFEHDTAIWRIYL